MRAESFSVYLPVSLLLPAAAVCGAIAGLVRTLDIPKPFANFDFSAFSEIGLPHYGFLRRCARYTQRRTCAS